MFNEYLFHLCVCTCSNVMCMLKYLLIKPKYIFECFICFWKWFYTFVSYVFVQNAFLCFSLKNWFRGCLTRSSRLWASREKGLREIIFFILSHRNSCYCIATTSRPTASREILLGWKWIFPKSDRSYHYCLATVSRPKASSESWCALVAFLVTVSWLFCYSLTCEKQMFSVFNVADVIVFQNLSLPLLSLSWTIFNPKHYFN